MMQAILLVVFGVLTLLIAITDWDFIMDRPRAQMMIKLMGRTGYRILIGVIGVVLIVAGIISA